MGALLSTAFGFIAGPLLDRIIAPLTHIFDSYINKQITEAQLREQVQALLIGAVKDVEVTQAQVLSQTYASFMSAMVQSKIMQQVWAAVILSQLFVLVWSQFFVPLLFAFEFLPNWKAGTSAEWAYLLIGALMGLGPLVLRAGPGAPSIGTTLKSMIGK